MSLFGPAEYGPEQSLGREPAAKLERARAALDAVRREYREAYSVECEARERRSAAEAALLLALRRVERLSAEEGLR